MTLLSLLAILTGAWGVVEILQGERALGRMGVLETAPGRRAVRDARQHLQSAVLAVVLGLLVLCIQGLLALVQNTLGGAG